MYVKLILKPILTENMAILQERENKFAFLVTKDANKPQIKKAVEEKFDVKVKKIATMNGLGKTKQMTIKSGGRVIRTRGKRSNWKKAVVTLNDGFTIDLVQGETAS